METTLELSDLRIFPLKEPKFNTLAFCTATFNSALKEAKHAPKSENLYGLLGQGVRELPAALITKQPH